MAGIPLYETRTLLEALRRMMPARTFLRDVVFNQVKTFVTENIDVDFQKERRRVAPFIAKGAGGYSMDRQGFVTRNYTPPFVAPQRKLTVEDISNRVMGENIYSQRTPQDRQAEKIAEDLAFFEKAISRREEIMCRDILTTGQCTMNGYVDDNQSGYTVDQINYGFSQIMVNSGTSLWTATSTSDPFNDLKLWRKVIFQNSGTVPNLCIMAGNVVENFVTHPKITGILNRNVLLGILSPVAAGFQQDSLAKASINIDPYEGALTFVGIIPGLGLEIYQYEEWYDEDQMNGSFTTKPMIPDNTVILCKRGMGKRFYGAVTQMEMDGEFYTYEGMRVPKVWSNINADTRMIRTTSRPLVAPDVIEDWVVATVQ
jgi:hypothetical protein